MKLYEYAAKDILSRYGIPVPEGKIVSDAEGAFDAARSIGESVIKAQVLTGGRGKAGGIIKAGNPEEAKRSAEKILGMSIKGFRVKKVLVEKCIPHIKEMYLGITIDRSAKCPVIMASSEGGVDIEEIAKNSPEKIIKVHVHPLAGIHEYQARMIAGSLDRNNVLLLADIVKKLYRVFIENDCLLAEINPLIEASDGIIALDAKMIIDDNALFRQDYAEEEDSSPEGIAKRNGMSYVGLYGDIGCIVNGAGLAMATLDMIKHYGGDPANFMDIRAGAGEKQVKKALEIIISDKKVKAIVINIFGGLTKCDEVALGIIDILPYLKIPLVVRLTGTNEEKGREILAEHGIQSAASTEEAARGVVELGNTGK